MNKRYLIGDLFFVIFIVLCFTLLHLIGYRYNPTFLSKNKTNCVTGCRCEMNNKTDDEKIKELKKELDHLEGRDSQAYINAQSIKRTQMLIDEILAEINNAR